MDMKEARLSTETNNQEQSVHQENCSILLNIATTFPGQSDCLWSDHFYAIVIICRCFIKLRSIIAKYSEIPIHHMHLQLYDALNMQMN